MGAITKPTNVILNKHTNSLVLFFPYFNKGKTKAEKNDQAKDNTQKKKNRLIHHSKNSQRHKL